MLQIKRIVQQLLQDLQMKMGIGRDASLLHHFRIAEVISLEEPETFLACLGVILMRFDFLGEQGCRISRKLLQKHQPLFMFEQRKIYLDVVRQFDERRKPRLPDEVIESDAESESFEQPACLNELGSRLNRLQHF